MIRDADGEMVMAGIWLRIKSFVAGLLETFIIGPICLGGLQNIFVWFVVIMIIKRFCKSYKEKTLKLFRIIVAVVILILCIYTMIDLQANVRLLIAFSGHPAVAYKTDDEMIVIKNEEKNSLDVEFKSGRKDINGFDIAPLTIRVYRLGVIYYSRFTGNG